MAPICCKKHFKEGVSSFLEASLFLAAPLLFLWIAGHQHFVEFNVKGMVRLF